MSPTITFSDVLGYSSIVCWLGAQFPQVIKNYQTKSVEGLSLQFLMNWLLGDLTNLIGCILTHQLPFQTWLAIYFVIVDCNLIGQYAYYSKSAPAPTATPRLRGRSASFAGRSGAEERNQRYRAISSAAASVAATAALAAHQEAMSPRAHRSRKRGQSIDATHEGRLRSSSELTDEEVDEETLARLADSFHSERGNQKHVSWSKERTRRSDSLGPPLNPTPTSSSILHARQSLHIPQPQEQEFDQRGRSSGRESSDEDLRHSSNESTHVGRGSSSKAHKRIGMVFLSVGVLFGFGVVSSSRGFFAGNGLTSGLILAKMEDPVSVIPLHSIPTTHVEDAFALSHLTVDVTPSPTEPLPPPPYEQPSLERIIGRISAWMCTTLYLTSRLPQIWKNFVRKSVEGLSMYLFIFAFLGNFFYVTSILTSPNLELLDAADYIKESIPYILGSAGTLMFDVTIIMQSYFYPSDDERSSRDSIRRGRNVREEEEGLLSATGATGATGGYQALSPHRILIMPESDDD